MVKHAGDEGRALLLIDVQYDFLPPDGSLAVPDGRAILPVVRKLLTNPGVYGLIVATRVCRILPSFAPLFCSLNSIERALL